LTEIWQLDEAAEIIGVDRSAFYRWNKAGKIGLYKKGSRTVVKRTDVDQIKKENETVKPFDQK
jgi:excisionase family DNA binding protein